MTITTAVASRNAAADAVVDKIDDGAGAGTLVLLSAAAAEVATLTFSDPAFGASSSGVATASAITDDSSATGGTTTNFEARDSDANVIFAGSVGTSGSDINLTNNVITATESVSISSFTYTAGA